MKIVHADRTELKHNTELRLWQAPPSWWTPYWRTAWHSHNSAPRTHINFFSDFIFNCAEKEGPFVVYSELEKRRSRNYKKKWVKTLNKVKEEIRLSHIWGKLWKLIGWETWRCFRNTFGHPEGVINWGDEIFYHELFSKINFALHMCTRTTP